MLKRFISREPEGNVVPLDATDGATIAVASVIHQNVDPELGEVPDLEGYRQREGICDVKLGIARTFRAMGINRSSAVSERDSR